MRRRLAPVRWLPRVDPLGPGVAIALLLGTLAAFDQGSLAPRAANIAVLALALPLWALSSRLRAFAAFVLGFALASLHAAAAMDARLPHALEGVDLRISGAVIALPQREPAQLRFDLRVDAGEGEAAALVGRRLRLGWYGQPPQVDPGSRWQLQVRLKRPRGSVNPGGFDFERHALERGLAATGYVRDGEANRELASGGGIHALRLRLSEAIEHAVGAPRARFVQALAVGDTRALDEHDWEVLRATGIAHLIAISGMHVGLVAGFGALLMAALYRLRPGAGLRLPLPQAAALAALLFAAGYTALAGFALPTVRTLLMIAAALVALLLRRRFDAWQAFALALLAVLLVDPLCVLGAGFWLSFLGVAWLIWCLPQERAQPAWRSLLTAQGVMTLSLLPMTAWFFGEASVIGPLANLVAVPWVSFVVVPFALLGTALALFVDPLGAPFFAAAAWLMQALWSLLEPAASLRGAMVYLPEVSRAALALALLGAFWLLLPRAVPGKVLALALFVPLLWPRQQDIPEGSADVWLLDVGQGLSLLVRTRAHALLYDAGPSYRGGLDMGEAAVLPALRALGIGRLDAYVESHGDNDHAGGSDAIVRAYAPPLVLATDPRRLASARRCEAGTRWQWDGVEFEVLHPPPHFPYLRNDSSCVLRVQAGAAVALLPGDISTLIEDRLRRDAGERLRADLLLVPHHGSRTSSSEDLLQAVAPDLALIGVGHRNRFELPRADVIARYTERDIALLDTATSGAIRIRLGPQAIQSAAEADIERWRPRLRPFWRED